MRITVLSSLFAALLAGCGSAQPSGPAVLHDPCHPLAVVAPGASELRTAAISDALESWNSLGLTQLTQDDSSGDRVEVSFEKAAGVFHGLYDPQKGTVAINDDLVDRHSLSVVIAHELGHAMGLVHVSPDDRASVMNPGNVTVSPTQTDSGAISAMWNGCR
ncbi:MAG: hypothetical protein QM723_40225 [Myxococcaceae bacterium]